MILMSGLAESGMAYKWRCAEVSWRRQPLRGSWRSLLLVFIPVSDPLPLSMGWTYDLTFKIQKTAEVVECQFPVVVQTKYHKVKDLEQQKVILL